MTFEKFLNDRVELRPGDCMEVLRKIPDNSIDSCVSDPPYHLTSIVKRFGAEKAAPAKVGKTGAYARASAGFMGKQWDGGDIAFTVELWAEVYRILKPGAFVAAFGSSRGYHRMACAIEDAGFEIRDSLMWLYGSGFPKSHDVSKGIDKAAGASRETGPVDLARHARLKNQLGGYNSTGEQWEHGRRIVTVDSPATPEAAEWEGFGTALKPAFEPIVLARKPLSEGTVAANVLRWRTGALNIGACRIEAIGSKFVGTTDQGRWPANVLHDGSPEVVGLFPDAPGQQGIVTGDEPTANGFSGAVSFSGMRARERSAEPRNDSGSAARFFYTAKADSNDRLGSKHPTVKPLDLMQYLARLITPPGGTVIDPFAGTGTTGEAAWREGLAAILIEREAEYQADIRRRMKFALGGPEERRREIIRASGKTEDAGPLFGSLK